VRQRRQSAGYVRDKDFPLTPPQGQRFDPVDSLHAAEHRLAGQGEEYQEARAEFVREYEKGEVYPIDEEHPFPPTRYE